MSRIRQARGFTLIEILIVLTLIVALSTLVATNIVGRMDSVSAAGSARKVAALLRHTRLAAIKSGEQQVLTFHVKDRTLVAPQRAPEVIPDHVDFEIFTATSEIADQESGSIRFFPDGGSTGGKITLTYREREWQVRVGWLTGDIDILDSAKPPPR